MADQTAQDTDEQAVNPELQKWEGDFSPEELTVKYSNDEESDESSDEEDTTSQEDTADNDEQDDDLEEIYEDPAPVITVDDPGDYEPKDHSFSTTIDGKTVKIKDPEQAEEFLEEHADEFTAKELVRFMRQTNKMEAAIEKDMATWESQKEAFESQSDEQAERDNVINSLSSEITYLINQGKLPKVSDELKDADWDDPQVAKQPGVKEQKALISYMVDENDRRAKAGVRPITSILDAYNGWKMEQDNDKEAKDRKEDGEKRRRNGARVASTNSNASEAYVPKGIAVGNPNALRRSASAWDN